jgi:2-polyprenyl-3-methyl-5-hydroxy-6-metoxy-1,4-benzoquinol methylase
MTGCVERLSADRVKGWAPHDPARQGPALVRVLMADDVLGEAVAETRRADVAKVLNSAGTHGFDIRLTGKVDQSDLDKLKVVASYDNGWKPLRVLPGARPATAVRKQSYQDFGGGSSSQSHKKLEALRLGDLPRANPMAMPLEGKSVLDLGCNEGFFCIEAMRQGASRVVGIDFKQEFIDSARQRCPDATFIRGSWWDIPNEKFDCIFFLSAIHYEREQQRLLRKLCDNHLKPNGVLVLECGAINEPYVRAWRAIKRWDGVKKYPTLEMLKVELLRDYAVRPIGRSVDQKGDSVPRYVFHCTPHAPIAMLIGGDSKRGKTNLSFQFEHKGMPTYATDALLKKLIIEEMQHWRPISQALRKHFGSKWPIDISKMGSFIVDKKLTGELCDIIVEEVPVEAKVFCIQGELLRHEAVQQVLKRKLAAKNVRPWLVTPL